MKRIFLAVAMLALVLPTFRQAEARVDVSIDFFYDNLGEGGSWIEVGDYGYGWQPSVAVSNTSWRPYTDGYWAYTDLGWTWISYEDFGWATYHYGRWIRLRGRGWVWIPGREWGPAWVSWRTGGDYIGWAPLPPRHPGEYWDESPITARVDINFDIGPAYYNFIDIRYIGEPVLRERIFAPEQNVTYITKTVNVTNITYNNSTVYNYGPDYNTVSRYSTRPIQRLSLQRETNVDPATAVQSKSLMKVQGDKLVVAAPQELQKPAKPIAPKVVKEKIAKPPVERGWEPVSDPKAQAELKEKIKKENPKSIPPPTIQATEKATTSPAASTSPASATASVTPATPASPAAVTSPTTPRPTASVSPGKDKSKRNEKTSPPPNASASAAEETTSAPKPEKNKNKRNEKVAPAISPSASVPPVTTPVPTRDKGKNKQRENVKPNASVPSTRATESSPPSVAPKSRKEKPEKPKVQPPPVRKPEPPRVAPPPVPEKKHEKPVPNSTNPPAFVEKPKHERPPAVAPKKKNEPPQQRVQPPGPPSKNSDKKQKKNEPSTAPTP